MQCASFIPYFLLSMLISGAGVKDCYYPIQVDALTSRSARIVSLIPQDVLTTHSDIQIFPGSRLKSVEEEEGDFPTRSETYSADLSYSFP